MPRPDNFRLHTTAQRGRLTGAEKHRLENLLPRYVTTFQNLPRPLEVELGMGNGLALLQRARAEPGRHYIGCELYQAGMATLLYHIKESDKNISLVLGDARDLLKELPDGSVNRLLLPHPDPWPKARHHKRRILNVEFLDDVRRVLEPEGEFWFVTDWPDYAEYARELLLEYETRSEGKLALRSPQGEAGQAAPPWWAETKYQQKARKQGREAVFFVARPAS